MKSALAVPQRLVFGDDDIRFEFDLGGGALMDMGVYTYAAVSSILIATGPSRLFQGYPPCGS